jgi:hypothetical protein
VLAHRGFYIGEENSFFLEVLADVVVDHLGIVLRSDAGEEFTLRLRNAQALVGLLDVVRQRIPGILCGLRRSE